MKRTGSHERLAASAALVPLLLSCAVALAATRIVSTSTAREFLAGDFRGTGVGASGRLSFGASFGDRAWPEVASGAAVFAAAADPAGRIFVATGGSVGRLFLAEGKTIAIAFSAAEPNVTAVAIAGPGVAVCATSPNGQLTRVDASGPVPKTTPWGSPGEASIWSLAFGPDGSLYVGTGPRGRIYRRSTAGTMEIFCEAEDQNVRSLAVGKDGTVYAGTSEKGLLLAIGPDGKARTLHDFGKQEVTAILPMSDGSVYAAAANADAPAGSYRAEPQPRPAQPSPTPTPSSTREETPKGTVSVSTSSTRPAISPSSSTHSEIVIVRPDGYVEPAWGFPEDTVYALGVDPAAGGLLISTGPRGRIYVLEGRHLRLEAQTDEKIVVGAFGRRGALKAVTANGPGVFSEADGRAQAARTYTSSVRDAGRISVFGRLQHEGETPAGASVTFFVRAGNSQKPDGTWTSWFPVGPDGRPVAKEGVLLSTARFFQWKVELTAGTRGEAPEIERVEVSYRDRNARPVLENLTVLEPGAVFPRGGASSGPAVLSVTNPDENGIFAGVEPPKETSEAGGRKLYRKGFRTLTWKGIDPNGDPLRYDVELRRVPGKVSFLVRKEVEESFLSFDTAALPDGRYRFRVTASDRAANPEGEALTSTEESDVFIMDNTPPSVRIESAREEGGELVIRGVATDLLSSIVRIEGSLNADRWRPLAADDGAFDSLSERFTFRLPRPLRPSVVAVRVVDGAGNVAAASVEVGEGAAK